jgi:hypothetical protein
MNFLNTTADLLTFQTVSDVLDGKMNGGISVYSSVLDKQNAMSGGSSQSFVGVGSLKDSYIPIGLYLDNSLPKNEVKFDYGGECNYDIIDDRIYDKLIDAISMKKYSAGKTLKLKTIFKKSRNNSKTAKTYKE